MLMLRGVNHYHYSFPREGAPWFDGGTVPQGGRQLELFRWALQRTLADVVEDTIGGDGDDDDDDDGEDDGGPPGATLIASSKVTPASNSKFDHDDSCDESVDFLDDNPEPRKNTKKRGVSVVKDLSRGDPSAVPLKKI